METIKEGDDEENELEEGHKLIESLKTLDEFGKPQNLPNLTRKSTFPRNFSTVSFMAPPKKRRGSKDSLSLVSSYSRLDFTGSSLQLHLEVSVAMLPKVFVLTHVVAERISKPRIWKWSSHASQHELSWRSPNLPPSHRKDVPIAAKTHRREKTADSLAAYS